MLGIMPEFDGVCDGLVTHPESGVGGFPWRSYAVAFAKPQAAGKKTRHGETVPNCPLYQLYGMFCPVV
jgi:hypothetical protein